MSINLDKYNREELIQIIKTLTNNNVYKLQSILYAIDNGKTDAGSKTNYLIEKYQREEQDLLKKYTETLAPYKGQPASCIPHDVLNQAMKFYNGAEAARQRWTDIIKREAMK